MELKYERMWPTKRELHELPFSKIRKSWTIKLASGVFLEVPFSKNFLSLAIRACNKRVSESKIAGT